MDLQHWDLIYEFSLYEAACLAAGHDPNVVDVSKALRAKIDLIQEQLHKAYTYAGWDTMCRVPDPPGRDDRGLYSLRMGAKSYEIEEDKSPRFRREEIGRWFKALGYETVYPFGKVRDLFDTPRCEPISAFNTLSKVATSKTDRNVQNAHQDIQDSATNSDILDILGKKPAPNKRDSRRAPQPSEQMANADAVYAVIPAEPEERGTLPQTLLRLPAVIAESGLSRSTIYDRIKEGLWPKQVSLGERASGWPASEVAALNAARIASKSVEEIRQLVVRLATARKPAA